MEKVNHPSVDWTEYFKSIRTECPWSYAAWLKDQIDIVFYAAERLPLGNFQARIYVINAPTETVEAIAGSFNASDTESEWLFSYPGYGLWATPVPVLIQQNRNQLQRLREQIEIKN